MKSLRHVFVLSDQDRPAIVAIKAAISQLEGAAPKVDGRIHVLTRIGTSGMVLVPDGGIMAPTSPNAKPPTKRDLPWLPPEILWVPAGELRRNKAAERGWTQAQLAEVRTLLVDAQGVTLVWSSERSRRALDELAIELPDARRLLHVRIPAGAAPDAVIKLVSSAKPYRPSVDGIRARRHALALDYLVSTNFRIGVIDRLREEKVTSKTGLRLTFIMAGVLGAIATSSEADASQRMTWRRGVVVEREGGGFLALDAADPLPHDASYADVLTKKPRNGVRGAVVSNEDSAIAQAPPPPLTLGGLVRAGITVPDVLLALQYLGSAGLVAHAFDGGKAYAPVDRATLDAFIAFLPESFERGVLERVRAYTDAGPQPPKAERFAITPLIGTFSLPELSEREQRVWRIILQRWVMQLAGPVKASVRAIRIQLGGLHYATSVYTNVTDRGWCERLPTAIDSSLWRTGEQVRVAETEIEPAFAANRSLGELLDSLSLAWCTTPWESERVPGAVIASPRSVFEALNALIDEGLVAIDGDHGYVTALGKQVLAFLPAELRHPAWVANVRTVAQRASTPALQATVRSDIDKAITRYAQRIDAVAVTIAPRVWTAEESAQEKKPEEGARRSMEREPVKAERER